MTWQPGRSDCVRRGRAIDAGAKRDCQPLAGIPCDSTCICALVAPLDSTPIGTEEVSADISACLWNPERAAPAPCLSQSAPLPAKVTADPSAPPPPPPRAGEKDDAEDPAAADLRQRLEKVRTCVAVTF